MQELLYRQFASKMMGVCLRYANNRDEAEDMLQTGFIRMFEKLNDFRNEGSFEGWLRRIMVNCAIGYIRKHYKMVQLVDMDAAADQAADTAELGGLTVKDLLALIQTLGSSYRMIFNLYAIEGYSHREIGEMLGITEGASKSQLSRARSMLKAELKKKEGWITYESYAG
ncbi:MAG: sigma-70 family RNA polymerase sigma factor [Mucilaginibacter polytrichastri]|nr:sigma-70 family RNA polymerase sigma factor [Mucilaginibacter polytrichastri]